MKYTFEIVAPNGVSIVSDDLKQLQEFAGMLSTEESRTLVGNLLVSDASEGTWQTLTRHALESHGVRVTRMPSLSVV